MKRMAEVSWCAEDVRTLEGCEDWSDERCEEFLDKYEDDLQISMIQCGWDVLDQALIWEDTDVQARNRH